MHKRLVAQLLRAFLVAVIVFSFGASAATNKLSTSFELKNGLKVVIIPNHRVPVVCHMLWFKTGSNEDPEDLGGVAHYFEHMMFKGTNTLKEGEFSKKIAQVGGNDNAFTSYDYTAYYQVVSKDHLPLVMQLEADRMQNLLIDEKSAEIERSVISEERRSSIENNPSSMLAEKMRASLYQNTGYGRPIIGSMAEIAKIPAVKLREYYRAHYSPNNATLVISGDVTETEVRSLAEKYYGSIPAIHIAPRENPSRKTITRRDPIVYYDSKVKVPEWHRYYVAPSIMQDGIEHAFPTMLLSYILGGSETSVLYRHLVNDKKIAAYIGVRYDIMSRGRSTFSIYAVPSETVSVATLQNAIEREIKQFLNTGIDDETMTRVKNLLIAEDIYSRDSIQQMAYAYGQALTVGLNSDVMENWSAHVKAVTAKQVIDEATELFSNDTPFVTGHLLPEVKKP
ncbi:MAG: insulinase family protein [Proteobacteria bacterium]|nr:insulinase family protein [Pseudomonadota bacterium]